MTCGPFSGSSLDSICVQSLDGQLSVFEQEARVFDRYLPNFLVPGPLIYSPEMDSFLTCNSSFELECYKYQALVTSSSDRVQGVESQAGSERKNVQCEWKLCLGEAAIQILSATNFISREGDALNSTSGSGPAVDIIVLAERTLFVIAESGCVQAQLKLDFLPTTCHAFKTKPKMAHGSPMHLLVADSTGSVMLYHGMQLLWATKVQFPPVVISVAQFGNACGLLVSLGENGTLDISYLGTKPPSELIHGYERKDLQYDEMDEEHRKLLRLIRESTSETKPEPADVVHIRVQVPTSLDTTRGTGTSDADFDDVKTLTLRVFLSYKGVGNLDDVSISLNLPPPLCCNQESFIVPTLYGGSETPVIIPITLCTPRHGGCIPSSNLATVMASYFTVTGEPRVAHCEVQLPLVLFCSVVSPIKNASYKVTIDTNRMPPQLTTLFEEVIGSSTSAHENIAAAGNVLSFLYNNGVDVTVIVSKNAGRFRLQSSRFEALWLLLQELVNRLRNYFEAELVSESQEPLTISFQEALPLQDFFGIVDRHHAVRAQCGDLHVRLGECAHQFRAVQKRLLMRFKDKNPVSLSHLDSLLEGTFNQINGEATCAEKHLLLLHETQHILSAAVQTILLLIQLRFGMDEDGLRTLRSYITPLIQENFEHGWEEQTEASVAVLLKTLLAKNANEGFAAAASGHQQNVALQDTNKLKKHISVVCERLARGSSLSR